MQAGSDFCDWAIFFDLSKRDPADSTRRFRKDSSRRVIFLQSFSPIEFSKISVKDTQGNVTGLPSYFENQTIGEPQRRTATVVLECAGDGIRVLDGEISVMQEYTAIVAAN
jgi:hypothetical protein